MKYIKTYLILMLAALFINGCSGDADGDYYGENNSIVSFTLKQNGLEFHAAISSNELTLTVPENLSLANATVNLVVSTNAVISPNPATITNWDEDHVFTVTSYDSKKTYNYHVERNIVSQDGDITLLTQGDVENLVALNVSQINGNLVIGAASGSDSIYSLASLSGLKAVTNRVIVNPTYAADNMVGLENLERVGSLEFGAVKGLKEVAFGKLKTVVSNLIMKDTEVEAILFPELTSIDRNIQIENIAKLGKIEFPKVEMIGGNVTIKSYSNTSTFQNLSFPVLGKIGGTTNISDWAKLENISLPQLKSTLSLNILSLSSLKSFSAPKFESVYGDIVFSYCLSFSSLDLGQLKTIPGKLNLQNLALENLSGLKLVESIGGELFISDMAALKTTEGFNSLKQIGGRIYMSNIPLLNDDFAGMSALSSVGGDIVISQVPFKKFSAFALKTANNLSLYSAATPVIEEIDVTKLTSVKALTVANITNQVKVKGPASFDGKLSIESSNVVLEGFNEVKELNYNITSNMQPTQTVNISKVLGNANVSVYNFDKLDMPNLTEIGGKFTLSCVTNMTLGFPKLKSCGSMEIAATKNDLVSFPVLESVKGDCKITSANYQGSLGELQMPALKQVDGKLDISGYSNYYVNNRITNLNSLSQLTKAKEIVINYNSALVDFTGLKNVISSITVSEWKVSGNSFNPTYQQMVDGSWVKP